MTSKLPTLCSGILILFTCGAAVAAGGPHEDRIYKEELVRLDLACAEDEERVVQNDAQGHIEEFCEKAGVRDGYYLKWHRGNDVWAMTGRYIKGQRSGRWVEYDRTGQQYAELQYKRGQLTGRRLID